MYIMIPKCLILMSKNRLDFLMTRKFSRSVTRKLIPSLIIIYYFKFSIDLDFNIRPL